MAVIKLTEYQKRWVEDGSRFKEGIISRQGGKSFMTALEAVNESLPKKDMWVCLSAGERQSKEWMTKAAMHARAAGMATEIMEKEFWGDDTRYRQLGIDFPNGSRIVGLPANPDTARGWSANVILDEFALHRHSREIWKAMYPTITRGYKIRVVTTFKGKNNKAYELFYSAPTKQIFRGPDHEFVGERGGWSKHIIDIHAAIAMGLDLLDETGAHCDPEDLRLALADDDAWQEEYLCIPSDEAHAFLPHDLISTCEDVKIDKNPSWTTDLLGAALIAYDFFRRRHRRPEIDVSILANLTISGRMYLGFDIGRKKDLSVIWIFDKTETAAATVAVIELKRQPYFVQEHILHTLCRLPKFHRAAIDETGLGGQMAETAADLFGSRIEGVAFTPESKENMAIALKSAFEDRRVNIPADAVIRQSLHSVKRYETTTKHFRFDAERSDATGHADHFWALALATAAAFDARRMTAPPRVTSSPAGRRMRAQGGRYAGGVDVGAF